MYNARFVLFLLFLYPASAVNNKATIFHTKTFVLSLDLFDVMLYGSRFLHVTQLELYVVAASLLERGQ